MLYRRLTLSWLLLALGWQTACTIETKPIARPIALPTCEKMTPPDWVEIRSLLERDQHEELDKRMQAYWQAYQDDLACEPVLWMAFDSLEGPSPERLAALDRWVEARPDSVAAHAAWGGSLVRAGYLRRGSLWAKDTTGEQFNAMREHFSLAHAALGRAIEIDPRHPVAYARSIEMLKAHGQHTQAGLVLSAYLDKDPLNFGVRRRMLDALVPKWGGSLEAMESLAQDAQQHAERNPRLRLLLGFADEVRAESAKYKKDYDAALEYYRKALTHGEFWRWLEGRAALHEKLGHTAPAMTDTTRTLAIYPDRARSYVIRGRARYKAGDLQRALHDLDRAVELNPTYDWAYRSRGWVHHKEKDWTAAATDYRAALELIPHNKWTRSQLAAVEEKLAG